MSYAPIAFTAPNYRDYKDWWIKPYEPGTTTPKYMATDSTLVTLIAKAELNQDGFIKSAGGALIVPYIDGAYDLWLFPTEAEADANDTVNALRLADNITGVSGEGFDGNVSAIVIADLSQDYTFPTVAAYKASAIEFPVGKRIYLEDRGAYFLVLSGVTTGNGIIVSDIVAQSIQLNVVTPNGLQVEWFGFSKGGSHTDNKAAIVEAIAFAQETGTATILFNDYSDSDVNCGSAIQLFRGATLKMNAPYAGGAALGGLLGDGVAPIFLTGEYTPGGSNTPSLIREITFDNMVATNTDGHPIAEIYSPNFTCEGGRFNTTDSENFKCRFSFRLAFKGGKYTSNWTVQADNNYTITAYDNCNGMLVTDDCVISGGTNGGGVDVSQTQRVNVSGIYETMGNRGVRVAGYDGLEKGNCNAVEVSGYFEACEGTISFGKENRVTGCSLGETFISQASSVTSGYMVELGKIDGIKAGANCSLFGNGTESAFLFTQGATGSGTLSTENAYIEGVRTSDVLSDYSIDGSLTNAFKATAFNSGRVQIGSSERTGVCREHFSANLTANVGMPADAIYSPITPTSGIIERVELLDVDGTLTGAVLRIGDTLSATRNLNFTLDTASISNGYADITSELSSLILRTAEPSTSRVIAGSGTGTFRYKITYKS